MAGLGVVGGCPALSKINVFLFMAMALGASGGTPGIPGSDGISNP